MKTMILALGLMVGGTAFACDCQKNQQQQEQAKSCDCGGGQSCPGECNHADPPKPEKKKKENKKG